MGPATRLDELRHDIMAKSASLQADYLRTSEPGWEDEELRVEMERGL